jgi:tetratricopeptide (TPR) repeat protein
LGDAFKEQGDYVSAQKNYDDTLSIRRELLSTDPANPDSQNEIASGYRKIGDLLMVEKKAQEALQDYQQAREIVFKLVAAEPANNEWQSSLAVIREKTGEALNEEGQLVEALQEFRASLAICENLRADDPGNAERAENEAIALFRIATTLPRLSSGSGSDVRALLSRARDILLDLKQRFPLSAINERHLEEITAALSGV